MGTLSNRLVTIVMKNEEVYNKVMDGIYPVVVSDYWRGKSCIREEEYSFENLKEEIRLGMVKDNAERSSEGENPWWDEDTFSTLSKVEDMKELVEWAGGSRWDLLEILEAYSAGVQFDDFFDLIFDQESYCEIETDTIAINGGYVWVGAQAVDPY